MALDVPFLVQAVWLMATGGYDVVHAVEEAAHLAAPFARLLGLPLVADVDSSIPDQLRYSGFAKEGSPLVRLAEALEDHALDAAAAVVTVCTSLTEAVKARAPRARVFQVEDPPLVDGPPSRDTPEAIALLRELGLRAMPVVLYSGNFEPYQGVERLLEAAPLVRNAQLLFMGGEPDEIARLRERALALGSGERCFFSGKRPPYELPAFLALSDVLASPRVQGENTPFKVFTYLASGKPLVATRIPTHTQLLDDSMCFLVEPTAQGLAAGIRQALEHPEDARARADRGRALIDREYSRTRYREKVAAAYEAIEAATR
jgi:glycosyltransferase involved in cell wall biosynthesis